MQELLLQPVRSQEETGGPAEENDGTVDALTAEQTANRLKRYVCTGRSACPDADAVGL